MKQKETGLPTSNTFGIGGRMSQKQPPRKRQGQVKKKFKFRVSEAEKRMVRKLAKKEGLTISAYIRMLIRKDAQKSAPLKEAIKR